MQVTIIGNGAISTYVQARLAKAGHAIDAILMRPERLTSDPSKGINWIGSVHDIPRSSVLVIDCAGHTALRTYGPAVLRAGHDLVTVSLGALADDALADDLAAAGRDGNARLLLASGAIGALDCLCAASVGTLSSVRYTGRKPPMGWRGSPAEDHIDLAKLTSGAVTHFTGSARAAALAYPKNANVAAAVALTGVGFDDTQVTLIADADAAGNTHEIHAAGDFSNLYFRLEGETLPDNPRTSALAAMSVVSTILERTKPVHF